MAGTPDKWRQRYRLRILLADDSLVYQKHAASLLEKHGHSVTVTNNGHEAVQALEHQDFDVVLMDVEMPVMNGLEAVSVIRERERNIGRRIPVVAVTTVPDRGQFLAAGMDGWLGKPLKVEAFNRTMQNLGIQP
jgi:CheY-like chemotaxis protein